jgi:hypothetical protein
VKHMKLIVIILAVVLVTAVVWPRRNEVSFQRVGSVVSETSFRDENNSPKYPGAYVWYCVTTNPDSELSATRIKQLIPEINFNFDEHNYVYAEGYTLNKLWYESFLWEKGDSTTKHYGHVELSYGGSPYETTIYEIPKLNVISVKTDRQDYEYVNFVP